MNKKPALIVFTVLFVMVIGMIIYRTNVRAPDVEFFEINDPASSLPIELDVGTNQEVSKILLVSG